MELASNCTDCILYEIDAPRLKPVTGLNIALLTIWDLVKPVNAALEITAVRLLYKCGGKRGTWRNPQGVPAEVEQLISEYGA